MLNIKITMKHNWGLVMFFSSSLRLKKITHNTNFVIKLSN